MFDAKEYESACRSYAARWETSDKILYNVCKQFPGHKDLAGTIAKLWLIGRAYMTGIERQIKSNGMQSNSDQLADHIWGKRDDVDGILKNLESVGEPLAENNLKTIVQAQGQLLRIVKEITYPRSPRSFVSKYLHFHCPAVPIYDMIVASCTH